MEAPSLLVGTANRHKLAEIEKILHGLPVRVLGAGALPGPVDVEETGDTFEENARLKALAFARAAAAFPPSARPRWVVSDDSGLCVDALGGAPGVRSARYAGAGHSDALNNEKLLRELAAVPLGRRGAAFVCAIACARVPAAGEEPEILFGTRGECRGTIGHGVRGSGGFGYDPLFIVEGGTRTYAELRDDEKNEISHRGRALRKFAELFRPALEGRSGEGAGR
jgi:XTP/dITP diphosphohydrolase